MDKLIVYVDDAAHAMAVLQPLLGQEGHPPRQWILVACAPRVTHHVSKWVTHSARESWRGKWTDRLFAQLVPWLQAQGPHEVQTCIGKNNLGAHTELLIREHGPARVVDARRTKQAREAQQPAWVPRPGLLGVCLGLIGPALLALD